MPLELAQEPADGRQVLLAGLKRVLHDSPNVGGTVFGKNGPPHAMKPFPVFTVGVQDLVQGRGLAAAELIAWRYLLVENNQVCLAADLIPDATTGGNRFGAVTDGYAEETEQALTFAETLPEVDEQKNRYELASLRIPALYFTALWLRNKVSGEDLFVAVPPAPNGFDSLRAYNGADLLQKLVAMAQARLAKRAPKVMGTAQGN